MLMKTVAALKADKAKTLDLINKGEGGFLDRDLYPFCANVSDGKSVALGNPNAKQLLGTDTRTLKDSTGKAFGQELYDAYQKPEGQITEVTYLFVRPGPDKTPVSKVSLRPKRSTSGSLAKFAAHAPRLVLGHDFRRFYQEVSCDLHHHDHPERWSEAEVHRALPTAAQSRCRPLYLTPPSASERFVLPNCRGE
jgi:hypothetical protein